MSLSRDMEQSQQKVEREEDVKAWHVRYVKGKKKKEDVAIKHDSL